MQSACLNKYIIDLLWKNYRNLTEEDVASVITYLRTIPPVKNKIPTRNVGVNREKIFENQSYPFTVSPQSADMNDPVNHGKYLISIGHCLNCHTNWNDRTPGAFGGGLYFRGIGIISTNISSDSTGIGIWFQ
jgi:mono/diheme cytochrome c family protein